MTQERRTQATEPRAHACVRDQKTCAREPQCRRPYDSYNEQAVEEREGGRDERRAAETRRVEKKGCSFRFTRCFRVGQIIQFDCTASNHSFAACCYDTFTRWWHAPLSSFLSAT